MNGESIGASVLSTVWSMFAYYSQDKMYRQEAFQGKSWQLCWITTFVGAKSDFTVCQLGRATPTEGCGLDHMAYAAGVKIEGHWQAET